MPGDAVCLHIRLMSVLVPGRPTLCIAVHLQFARNSGGKVGEHALADSTAQQS